MLGKLAKEAGNATIVSPSTKKSKAKNRTESDLSVSVVREGLIWSTTP